MAAWPRAGLPNGVADAEEPIAPGRLCASDISRWTTRFVVPREENAFIENRQKRVLQDLRRLAAIAMCSCCVFLVVTLIRTSLSKDDEIANHVAMMGVGIAFALSGSVLLVCFQPTLMMHCLGRDALETTAVVYFGLLAVVVVCTDARHIWEFFFPVLDDLANQAPAAAAPALGWRTSTLLLVLMLAASFMVRLRSTAVLCLLVMDLGLFVCGTMTRPSVGPGEFYPVALFVVCATIGWRGQRDIELSERLRYAQVDKFASAGASQVRCSFLSSKLTSSTRDTELTSLVHHTSTGSSSVSSSSVRSLGYMLSETGDQIHGQIKVANKLRPSCVIGVQASVLLKSIEIQTEMSFNPFIGAARVHEDMATFTEQGLEGQTYKPPLVPGRLRQKVMHNPHRAKIISKFNRKVSASSTAGRPASSDADSNCSFDSDGARSSVSNPGKTHATVVQDRSQRRQQSAPPTSRSAGTSRSGSSTARGSTDLQQQRAASPENGRLGTASSPRQSRRSPSKQSQGTREDSVDAARKAVLNIANDFCHKNEGMCRELLKLSMLYSSRSTSEGTPPSFEGRWVPFSVRDGLQTMHVHGDICFDGNGQVIPIEHVDGQLMLGGGKLSFAGNLLVHMRPSGATIAYSCVGHSTEDGNQTLNSPGVDLGVSGVWKPIAIPSCFSKLSVHSDSVTDGEGTLFPFARQSHPAARVFSRGMLISVGEYLVYLGTHDHIMTFVRA